MPSIIEQALTIRDETRTAENTAERVGSALADIATMLDDLSAAISGNTSTIATRYRELTDTITQGLQTEATARQQKDQELESNSDLQAITVLGHATRLATLERKVSALEELASTNQANIKGLTNTVVEHTSSLEKIRAKNAEQDTALSKINIKNLGTVATSGAAENIAANGHDSQPTLYLYVNAQNYQGGALVSIPASVGRYGGWTQYLLLGSNRYEREVHKMADSLDVQVGAWTAI